MASFKPYSEFLYFLLPIIPPDAELSDKSKLSPEHLGKIPGKRTSKGWVGFANWTEYVTSEKDLARWEKWDCGIGLQSRYFPGIDIDIDDEEKVNEICELAFSILGATAIRRRTDSNRILLMYQLKNGEEPLKKAIIKIEGFGKVEVLGDGQHYVIDGIHPKGGLYTNDLDNLDTTAITSDQLQDFIGQFPEVISRELGVSARSVTDDEAVSRVRMKQIVMNWEDDAERARWDCLRNLSYGMFQDGYPEQANRETLYDLLDMVPEIKRDAHWEDYRGGRIEDFISRPYRQQTIEVSQPQDVIYRKNLKKLGLDILAPENTNIGKLTEAIYKTAWIPNYMIAALSARAMVAYLAGGKYRTEVGDRVNIQQIVIGETGSGKDIMVNSIVKFIEYILEPEPEIQQRYMRNIIREANSTVQGISDRMGESDVHDILFSPDEFGNIYKQSLKDSNKAKLMDYALLMYSKADGTDDVRSLSQAGKHNRKDQASLFFAPHFIVNSASTRENFAASLNHDFIQAGYAARMCFFGSDIYREERRRRPEKFVLDPVVATKMLFLGKPDHLLGNKTSGIAELALPHLRTHNPLLVRFAEGVEDYYHEIALSIDEKSRRSPYYANIWNRMVVNAKKYAMIEAIAEDPEKPIISMEVAERNVTLVEHACLYSEEMFSNCVGESDHDVAMKAIVKKLQENHPEKMKRRQLTEITIMKKLRPHDHKVILEELVTNGVISEHKVQNGRGKPSLSYSLGPENG